MSKIALVVAGTATLQADKVEEAIELAQWMAQQTEAEPGCLAYRFYRDLRDPTRLFIFEEWASEEALAAHFETEHMRHFRTRLPTLLAGPLQVKRYDVEHVATM